MNIQPSNKLSLHGIWGHPYIDLSAFLDTSGLDAIDDEITFGLTQVEASYTGGSLKWMGVVAPWAEGDGYRDLMHAIAKFSPDELRRFIELGDSESQADKARIDFSNRETWLFGDETDRPLSRAQMLFLKYRHGVYFPWKVCYHLLENQRWEDKHSGEGKLFSEEARRVFPNTIRFIENLPFTEIGRAVLFGLEANDHAPAHRDSEPGKSLSVAQSISINPSGGKRFYLADPSGQSITHVHAPLYWFNDMDYHGVEAQPFFQYSIRVDGKFDRGFMRTLGRAMKV